MDTVPIDKSNALYKVGSQARADSLFGRNQTMTLATIALDIEDKSSIDSDDATGYVWTSSSGPDFSIPIGTEASVTVFLTDERPISLLLPFLKGISGQK